MLGVSPGRIDLKKPESSSSGIEQWLNLVAPALMRDALSFSVRDIASMSEVSPAK